MTRPERIAQEIHDTTLRLSAERAAPVVVVGVPWDELPEEARALGVAVVMDMMSRAVLG